jgi:hypothetical protein
MINKGGPAYPYTHSTLSRVGEAGAQRGVKIID